MTSERHLTGDNFARLLGSRDPIHHPIAGSPAIILFTDPAQPAVGLRVAAGPQAHPPDTQLENLSTRLVHSDTGRWIDLYVTDSRLFTDAYPVLCAVADRLQLSGLGLGAAIADTARSLGHLLQRPGRMALEKELGLFGELLLIWGLLDHLDAGTILAGWTGSDNEEHDFDVAGINIEVKTTSTERRVHWITSGTQLQPSTDQTLWLASHQLTRAGADNGHTLPELIDVLRRDLAEQHRDVFDNGLREADWLDSYRDSCTTRWRRRDISRAFLVMGTFPRITPMQLHAAGISTVHIPELRYRIDLTDQPVRGETPSFLADALARKEPQRDR